MAKAGRIAQQIAGTPPHGNLKKKLRPPLEETHVEKPFDLHVAGVFGSGCSPKCLSSVGGTSGSWGTYRKPADSSGSEELLYADKLVKFSFYFSPDGKYLAYDAMSGSINSAGIWILSEPLGRAGRRSRFHLCKDRSARGRRSSRRMENGWPIGRRQRTHANRHSKTD